MKKKKRCDDCIYGETNFWGYDECWLYNQELDYEVTIHTADRERTAQNLNAFGYCKHYKKASIFYKIWNWFEYQYWSIFR